MRWFIGIRLMAALGSATQLIASDSRPAIAPGATRAELIGAYGAPIGRSAYANVEVLYFKEGQAKLTNGRVERSSLKPVTRPPVVAQETATAYVAPPGTAPANEVISPLAGVWITDVETALRDAARRNSAILTLFTASDATPTSRQFQKEIVLHPEFVNAFRARYVLLQVDFPVQAERMIGDDHDQNETWRDRHGVRTMPALLILSATGEKLAEVEISNAVPGSAFRGRLIAAIHSAYELPQPVERKPVAKPVIEPPAPTSTPVIVAPMEVTSALETARYLITGAMVIGTLIGGVMLFALWLILRKINKPVALTRNSSMAARIDQAASGLPTFDEIRVWPKETLCNVITRLAETEGYLAEPQPFGSDKDLVLKRPGNPVPQIIVRCVTGHAGVIPARRLREMAGMLAAEDVPAGWFISPLGFSAEARAFAEQNDIRLIDGAGMLNRLSDLPSFALPKILAAAG